ncbi:MAG: glycosyltransferase [Roseburia sp.]
MKKDEDERGTINKERLIVMTGVYDTLDIFIYELMKEFQRMGYEVMNFDSSDMLKSLGKLATFVQTPVKAVITFNNLGFNMELTEGKNIWDELGIWCVNILMDHPFCHKAALDQAPAHSIVLCPDRNHVRYLQRFYPQISMMGYLPHGGKALQVTPKPIVERSIDVIYAGGLSKDFAIQIRPDFTQFSFDAKKIGEEAYQDMLRNPHKTTEQALEEALLANGVCLTEQELCDTIKKLHYVDLLITSYYREKVVQKLVESGVPLTLYGTGWEHCSWITNPNVDYRGRISADAVVEQMQNAKIVLSTMTWFKDGTHDRVFNGMLAGAVAVTDSSVYMKETFTEDELVMFELEEIDELGERVKALLSSPERMQQIADRGRKAANAKHTWAARAHELSEDLLEQL